MAYKFQNASVLVVDDMPLMIDLTRSILEIFGFQKVLTARDGEEAFDIFCKERPDLVITDWYMDPCDGMELTAKIRKDPLSPNPYAPIILMTGYSAKLRVFEARDQGITEFLVKPFKAEDLYARLEKLIEKPRSFVDASNFFGPDRRRIKVKNYDGPQRRGDEEQADKPHKAHKDLEKITKTLKDKNKTT
jgi:CheY-like chemotaxis protein